MNNINYFELTLVTPETTKFFIPYHLLPDDIVIHLKEKPNRITKEKIVIAKKTHEKGVYVIQSIKPFQTTPYYKPLQFVKTFGDTFQNILNSSLAFFRNEKNLPEPINYEKNAGRDEVKKVLRACAKKTVMCPKNMVEKLGAEASTLVSRNNQMFFDALLKLPQIDQISPHTQLSIVWQFLNNITLKKCSFELKKEIYNAHCRLMQLCLLHCVVIVEKRKVIDEEYQDPSRCIKESFNQLISCAKTATLQLQLRAIYQPLLDWFDSFLNLEQIELQQVQATEWINRINSTIVNQCVQITHFSSSKKYLMKWFQQNMELLNLSIISADFPGANYSSPIMKALFFHDLHELNRLVLEVKALSKTFYNESISFLCDSDQYKRFLVFKSSSCFLELISSLMERNEVHQILSKKMVEKALRAKETIEQLDLLPKANLEPIQDWAVAIKKAKVSPQFLVLLESLNNSWGTLKELCKALSENQSIDLFLKGCQEGVSEKSYMITTYFEAVREINKLLEKFYLCLNQLNDQVPAFQSLCLLIKSDKRLPQIETQILIDQFEEMNGRLKTYIQPTVDLLNGFQHILQLDGGVKKMAEAASPELTLKFRSEEITVHLFSIDPQLYKKFDQEVMNVVEDQEATIEITPIKDEVKVFQENDTFEERIDEIFAPKQSEKIKKRLFEFLKEEKIEFKTLFGKGDHLKLYLNGHPIPLPKHKEWKPGTKKAIKREILGTFQPVEN